MSRLALSFIMLSRNVIASLTEFKPSPSGPYDGLSAQEFLHDLMAQ